MGISAYIRSDTRLIPTPTLVPSGQWNLGRSVPLAAPEVLGRGTWGGATYRETLCTYVSLSTCQLRSQNEETGQSEGPNASSANERLPTVKPFSHWRILGHGSDQLKSCAWYFLDPSSISLFIRFFFYTHLFTTCPFSCFFFYPFPFVTFFTYPQKP